MNTPTRFPSILLALSLAIASADAYAINVDPFKTREVVQNRLSVIRTYCFVVPYSEYDLVHRWNAIMGLGIERLARENVPYNMYNSKLADIKYLTQKKSADAVVCLYYNKHILTYSY
ncbi:MAG: hypothetical protein WC791_04170 [Candidatus Paceibacterota bacterium]|jgi:hypothetical protein